MNNTRYKIIDPKIWPRVSVYNWFSTFSNPTYGFNADIDVTYLVSYSKKTKTSFFINFMYIVTKVMNEIEEMRLRLVDNEIRLYEEINPTWVVRVEKLNTFDNANGIYSSDYKTFYNINKEITEKLKNEDEISKSYNKNDLFNDLYITCIPWLSLTSMSHPIPDDKSSSSVPRICWDKFVKVNKKYKLNLNITVSHAFVDGKMLSDAFNLIQKYSLELFK